MPRENSFSDSEGRSLTPDMDEDDMRRVNSVDLEALDGVSPISPTRSHNAQLPRPPRLSLSSLTSPKLNRKITNTSRQTERSRGANAPNSGAPWSSLPPKDRFRQAVRKVMALRRSTTVFAGKYERIGAEPGVDPRRASADVQYSHIHQKCKIEIVDYSAVRSSAGTMSNEEFVNLINDPHASAREPWVKVRWINIGGMSWDVIKAVSIKYGLHPLALEDVFHTRSQTRSKADYYMKHLFLRVLCHELVNSDEGEDYGYSDIGILSEATRSASPEPIEEESFETKGMNKNEIYDEKTVYDSAFPSRQNTTRRRRRLPLLPNTQRDLEAMLGPDESRSSLTKLIGNAGVAARLRQKRQEHEVTLEALKKGERVNVGVSPMYIFLFRDGTVISIHPTPNLEFTAPISKRLRQRDTVLRTSADASMLVHSLLDLIVDNALEVINEYHEKINKFERQVLTKPQMKTVRHLHILSGDLILHKRTLEPIKTLVYGLRRYDVDRCAALIDTSDPANADVKVVGFMSHKSKIYLADVFDHMEYILSSLDMFSGIAENLISYTFNLASYEMNEVMRRLTLATIIFLPLTLLTGYFGMNFDPMWSVQKNSDLLFWEIALPVMAIIIPAFTWPDIRRLAHYLRKRMTAKAAVKNFKQA